MIDAEALLMRLADGCQNFWLAQEEPASEGPAGQHAAEAPAAASALPSGQLQQSGQPRAEGPSCDAEFEALPRLQLPAQGDVIGYRLLHIGADWTPQVPHLTRFSHAPAWPAIPATAVSSAELA
jgi:hypothetical protein